MDINSSTNRATPGTQTLVLDQGHPVLRLRMPSKTGAANRRPIDAMNVSRLLTRGELLEQTHELCKQRHQTADALSKLNPHLPSAELIRLQSEHKRLNKEIDQLTDTYQRKYGVEMLGKLAQWRQNVNRLLSNEGATTYQELTTIQGQLDEFVPELEVFFLGDVQQMHARLSNQITEALQRTHSRERYDRVRKMIDSDAPVLPNQLQKDDDQLLYTQFNRLSVELDDLISMLTMDDISDEQQGQIREQITIAARKIDKIRQLFSEVIHRYERLRSDQLYPYQLSTIEQTLRKAHRTLNPALEEPGRRQLVESLQNLSINTEHLLDMSEDDFQAVFALLSDTPLTEANRSTFKRNGWQLSNMKGQLVTQCGHDRVRVVSSGDNFRLIDNATGAPIGTLSRKRWDRIQHELAKRGILGADHITRQMIIDDYRLNPPCEAESRTSEFHGAAHKYGGSTGPRGCQRPSDQPAVSEPLRYGRRFFRP